MCIILLFIEVLIFIIVVRLIGGEEKVLIFLIFLVGNWLFLVFEDDFGVFVLLYVVKMWVW